MSAARERILAAVRTSLGRSGAVSEEQAATLHAHIARHPAGPRPHSEWSLVTRFRSRASQSASTVDAVETLAGVPSAVASYLRRESLPMAAVVWPELRSLEWMGAGVTVESRRAEGGDMVGVTGSFCAIAETGTLVLTSSAATPASVSLLPETHIAVVGCERIVRGMEDAWTLIRADLGALPRAVNFVSGPSRTADIEQTLVLGAHGPYRVHIVLVGNSSDV